ncbi:MAG: hypothetical protein ACXW4B_06470 [Micavibrio sp.]
MTVYFCLDDLLETLAASPAAQTDLTLFIPVQTKPPHCHGHREDALTLSSQPKLLDMNDQKGVYQLAALIEEAPLYQINLELLIDDILSQRHHNQLVEQALQKAFEGQPIPNTMGTEKKSPGEGLTGSLRHPMIGHLDKSTLAKIYLNFMRFLPHGHDEFSFEKNILGQHPGPFRENYDGFVFGEQGKVKADILLGFSVREDYDPRKPLEDYVEGGRRKAIAMQINEPHELLWAWLEADHYQLRRCHDIDRLLNLKGLPRRPNWVRTDVFNCLEKEAIKQVLATRLVDSGPSLSLAEKQPHIRKAIEQNAQGQIDESLQQLLTQTLNTEIQYSGAADKFYSRALDRLRESKTL